MFIRYYDRLADRQPNKRGVRGVMMSVGTGHFFYIFPLFAVNPPPLPCGFFLSWLDSPTFQARQPNLPF